MDLNVKNKYESLECHFNWNIRSVVGDKEVIEKLNEKNEEISGQAWRNLLILLTTAYELFLKKESVATHKLQEVITIWNTSDDDFILKYKVAFQHVIYSLKAFFIRFQSSASLIQETFNRIPSYSSLSIEQKAAITAIKANVFSEYGPNGTKHALKLAKQAQKENPNEGEWSFLVGKMLSRIRQFTLDHCITEEELDNLRHAYTLSKSPAHAVFLAQTYSSISKALFHKIPLTKGRRFLNNNEGRIVDGYNEKAYNLFKEALAGNNDKCIHINFRCAKGLFSLPGKFKDVEAALSLVEQNLERAPTNVFGHSTASMIYLFLKQFDKALKHALIAEEGGSYGASIKIIQMKIDLKLNIDVDKAYEELLKKQPDVMFKIQTCMHAITYFIFKKRNIFRALRYFFMAAEMDATLNDFYYYVFWIRSDSDICFLVYNEVKIAIDGNKAKNPYQLKLLRDCLTVISTKYPTVLDKKVEPKLVDYLLKQNMKFRPSDINHKYNRGRGRPNQMGRSTNENSKQIIFTNKTQNNNRNKSKNNFRERKGRPERKRSDSVSSNASAVSVSSNASTASFTRIRRNSREACLLDIVRKDEILAESAQAVKEVKNTNELSLRPCQEKNQVILGLEKIQKASLNKGCSGWMSTIKRTDHVIGSNQKPNYRNSEYKRRTNMSDNSGLNTKFANLKLNEDSKVVQHKFPSENKKESDYSMQRSSLNYYSDSGNSKYSRQGSNRPNNLKINKCFVNDKTTGDQFKGESDYRRQRSSTGSISDSGFTGNNVRGSPNYIKKTEGQNRIGRKDNNSGDIDHKYIPLQKNDSRTAQRNQLIRKPFNLNRRDSLDSDDSLPNRSNFDRLSSSSVDSDYVCDRNKSIFSWNKSIYR